LSPTRQPQQPWYRLPLTWLIPATLVLLVGLLAQSGFLFRLESISRDWRFTRRGAQTLEARVVIIEIDQATLDDPKFAAPLLFWGTHHARVFQTLEKLGARAIGFDIVQPVSPADYATSDPNAVQAEAVAALPQLVMAYTLILLPDGTAKPNLPNEVLRIASSLGGGRMGFANTVPDSDGVVRRFAPFDSDRSASFPLQVAALAAGKEPVFSKSVLRLGEQRFSTDAEGQIVIDYVGPSNSFPRVSYSDLLAQPDKFKKLLKNSICLIGATALDQQDIHAVPLTRGDKAAKLNAMPGVEIHANIVHTLLAGRDIRPASNALTWLLVALAALVAIPFAWLPRIGLVVPALVLLLVAWAQTCVFAFSHYGWQLPFVAVALACALTQILLSSVRLWQENRNKKWAEDVFGRYVSPAVVEHLRRTPGALELGGVRREVTVLFSDIRGFTQMSEGLEPEQVTRFLNNYLEKMVQIIFANGGTVDKFIGDGIMVIYNWPVAQPDHAARALQSAIEMQKAVTSAASEWKEMGMPAIEIGIGIHSGPAVVGNVGASQRMEQTAIGDTINVASRVEGLCKTIGKPLGSNILFSETSYEAAKSMLNDGAGAGIEIIPAGEAEVRGREKSLALFAVKITA
jgi:adenylate cyclase